MIIAALGLLGLCLGSFVNAMVYRLHWQETHKNAPEPEKKKYSLKSGRSVCPNCAHKLVAKDLIPIISWLHLKGKCRYCQEPISWQYLLVEISTAILFVFSYAFWPQDVSSTQGIIGLTVWLLSIVGFVALIVYDIRHLILPNKIIFPLLLVAFLGVLAESAISGSIEPIRTAAYGALIGGGLFYLLFQVSKGAWIGGGDVKLGFLIGLLIGGPAQAFLMLFFASMIGTFFSLPLLATKKLKTKSRIPFGPFLIVSAIIVQLFGQTIMDWYINYFAI